MVYTSTITTDANTLVVAPLVTIPIVTEGVLYRFEIMFPPGPSGLVGVQIRYHDLQLYPVQREEWFLGDNTTIGFDDLFAIDTPPFSFEIRTYNVDTDYCHLLQLRFGIVTKEEFLSQSGSFSELSELTDMLAEIKQRTEVANSMTLDEAREVARGAD